MSAADAAVRAVLRKINDDPRVAYYFAFSGTLGTLLEAIPKEERLELDTYSQRLKTEAPTCRSGECRDASERA